MRRHVGEQVVKEMADAAGRVFPVQLFQSLKGRVNYFW